MKAITSGTHSRPSQIQRVTNMTSGCEDVWLAFIHVREVAKLLPLIVSACTCCQLPELEACDTIVVGYIVVAALDDHLKRHPDLKSQAGNKKTKVREGGIPTPPKRERKPKVPRWEIIPEEYVGCTTC